MRKLLVPTLLVFLSACTLGPEYKRPDVKVPQNHRGLEGPAKEASGADLSWQDLTAKDPVLNALIAEALKNNKDIGIAAARVDQYRALAGINPLWPNVYASAGAGRNRSSETIQPGLGGQTSNLFDIAGSVSWEIDLWGRLRKTNEATFAQYLASEEAQRGVIVSLISDVTSAYLNLRSLDMQLDVAKRTLESRGASFDLVDKRLLGGIATKLDSNQAESALAQAAATIPQLEQFIFAQENALSYLLGRPPGPVERGVPIDVSLVTEIPAGLPSALLERRPDVRQAEQLLRLANAQVGIAEASLFPQLSLTGSLGFQSAEVSDLLKSGSFAWNVGAGLLAPIFQGGKLRKNLEATKAAWEQSRLGYEKVVLAAFGDVSTSLNAVRKTREVAVAQAKNLASLREIEKLALVRYDGGVSPYLEVLDAQRQLFNGELFYVQALRDQRLAIVQLYKALGGGWSTPAAAPAAPAAEAPVSK